MATPLSAARALEALRDEGLRVVQHGSWRSHNRGSRGTGWGPLNGVMIHHTVTSGVDGTVRLCYQGRSDLPGPLCHGVIDKQGTVHLVGWGRANHAGLGDDDVLRAVIREDDRLPAPNQRNVDGNSRFYGFECINLGDGHDPWPDAQLDAIERAAAALCRAHGWGANSVIGHKEWTSWKIDPKGFSMEGMRARIAARLAHKPGYAGNTNTTEEGPMQLDMSQLVPVGDWIAEGWPHAKGDDPHTITLHTALGSGYGHARRAGDASEQALAELKKLRAERAADRAILDKLVEAVGKAGDFDVADLKREIRAAAAEAVESIQATVTLDVADAPKEQ